MFYFIKDAGLLNFVDDKKVVTFPNTVNDLFPELQGTEKAIEWFCLNEMLVNFNKFQYIIINRPGKLIEFYRLQIDNLEFDLENSVTWFGVKCKYSICKYLVKYCITILEVHILT